MENLERFIDTLLQKHCHCEEGENRILLESISICPTCESIFSTLIYRIPREHLREVLQEIDSVMSRHGITREGAFPSTTISRHDHR